MNLNAISYFSSNGFYTYEGLYQLYMFIKEGSETFKDGGSSYSSCSYGFGAVRKNHTVVLKGIETALSKSRPGSSLFLDIDLNKNLLGVLSYLLVRLPNECYTPTRFVVTDALYVDIGNSKHVVITPKEDALKVEILNATLGTEMIVRVFTKSSVKNFKVGNYAHGIHVVSMKDGDLRQMRRKLLIGGCNV